MHFWIDKRSQCAYTGRRRVPSSLSPGVGRGRVGVRPGPGVCRKGSPMAAPVHRFALAADCPRRPRPHSSSHNTSQNSSSHSQNAHSHNSHNSHNTHNNHSTYNHHRQNGGGPIAAVHSSRRQNEEQTLYVDMPVCPPQPTIASLAAARSVTPDTLLRTAALGLNHSPMMAPHLKFGMLVSFALASLFLASAKYYFDKQVVRGAGAGAGSGGEAGVVCAAVACVCGVGCALSLCRARPPPPVVPDRVSSTAARHRQTPPSEPSDDISLTTLLQSNRPAEPSPEPEAPPPYHIAVLLPTRDTDTTCRDTSPPAYSALS